MPLQIPRDELVVLTGDLVGSSRLSPSEIHEAMRALEEGAWGFARQRGGVFPYFTRFRGDGWQCVAPAPGLALRAALLLRAHLGALGRSYDTRVSIGIGAGFLLEGESSLDGAGGPAFELSGRGLDKMPHAPRFAIHWEIPPSGAPLIEAIFALSDEISRHWTPRQARVFAALLGPTRRPNQEALAFLLSIKQQGVARHLMGGGDWALRQALDTLEGTVASPEENTT